MQDLQAPSLTIPSLQQSMTSQACVHRRCARCSTLPSAQTLRTCSARLAAPCCRCSTPLSSASLRPPRWAPGFLPPSPQHFNRQKLSTKMIVADVSWIMARSCGVPMPWSKQRVDEAGLSAARFQGALWLQGLESDSVQKCMLYAGQSSMGVYGWSCLNMPVYSLCACRSAGRHPWQRSGGSRCRRRRGQMWRAERRSSLLTVQQKRARLMLTDLQVRCSHNWQI